LLQSWLLLAVNFQPSLRFSFSFLQGYWSKLSTAHLTSYSRLNTVADLHSSALCALFFVIFYTARFFFLFTGLWSWIVFRGSEYLRLICMISYQHMNQVCRISILDFMYTLWDTVYTYATPSCLTIIPWIYKHSVLMEQCFGCVWKFNNGYGFKYFLFKNILKFLYFKNYFLHPHNKKI
jgi:hypothetical protein